MALKVLYNYGVRTTMTHDINQSEYQILRHLPAHPNVIEMLGVVGPVGRRQRSQ